MIQAIGFWFGYGSYGKKTSIPKMFNFVCFDAFSISIAISRISFLGSIFFFTGRALIFGLTFSEPNLYDSISSSVIGSKTCLNTENKSSKE